MEIIGGEIMQNQKIEDLVKSIHSMEFAVGSLQDALRNATSVESIVLLDLIGKAQELKTKIDNLHGAIDGNDTV